MPLTCTHKDKTSVFILIRLLQATSPLLRCFHYVVLSERSFWGRRKFRAVLGPDFQELELVLRVGEMECQGDNLESVETEGLCKMVKTRSITREDVDLGSQALVLIHFQFRHAGGTSKMQIYRGQFPFTIL